MNTEAEAYNLIGKWINATGLPTILIAGLIGNTVCFLVYSRKNFAKTTCGHYLKALSIADIAFNLAHLQTFLYQGLGLNITNFSPVSCKLFSFGILATGPISAWIEALVSFDRAVNIGAPNKLRFLQKKRNMNLIMAAVLLLQFGLYSPILYYFELVEGMNRQNITNLNNGNNATQATEIAPLCSGTSPRYIQVLNWYDLFNSTIIPFTVMLASTIVILVKLRATRSTVSVKLETISPNSSQSRTAKSSDQHKKRQHRDFQFAVTSVSLCLLFFVLNIGKTLYFLLSSYDIIPFELFQVLASSFGLFSAADFSLKIIIYLLVNNHFRSEFLSMIKCKRVNTVSNDSFLKEILRLNNVGFNLKKFVKGQSGP